MVILGMVNLPLGPHRRFRWHLLHGLSCLHGQLLRGVLIEGHDVRHPGRWAAGRGLGKTWGKRGKTMGNTWGKPMENMGQTLEHWEISGKQTLEKNVGRCGENHGKNAEHCGM